jgi:transcriptional regulator GlxA family with amidase domain
MNVGIYIYNHAEVLDFAGPFEVFSTASRVHQGGDPFHVFLVSEKPGPVKARGGFSVNPAYHFIDHPAIEVLIVVGGLHTGELKKPSVINWIARTAKAARLVASVCTGAFLLAEAGLLDDLNVTTHWEDIPALRQQYPKLMVHEDKRWVDEGRIVTSGGISAGIDMSLQLVSKLHSLELAQKTARQMAFEWQAD